MNVPKNQFSKNESFIIPIAFFCLKSIIVHTNLRGILEYSLQIVHISCLALDVNMLVRSRSVVAFLIEARNRVTLPQPWKSMLSQLNFSYTGSSTGQILYNEVSLPIKSNTGPRKFSFHDLFPSFINYETSQSRPQASRF